MAIQNIDTAHAIIFLTLNAQMTCCYSSSVVVNESAQYLPNFWKQDCLQFTRSSCALGKCFVPLIQPIFHVLAL